MVGDVLEKLKMDSYPNSNMNNRLVSCKHVCVYNKRTIRD